MLKKFVILSAFLILIIVIPSVVFAQGGFLSSRSVACRELGQCTFCDFMLVIQNIFSFLRNNIAFPLALLVIIYGALMMIFSGGSTDKTVNGRKILTGAVIGFAIIVGMSLILNTVLVIITGSKGDWQSIVTGYVSCDVQ